MPEPAPRDSTRVGVALFAFGAAAIGVAYASAIVAGAAPAWAPRLVAFGAAATSVALFMLGAATRGPVGRGTRALLAVLFIAIAGSFLAALALPADEGPGGPMLLGLPLRLAVVFYGVGVVPLVALPLAFARTFRAHDRS